jgi:voltage-gated potassium channel
MKKKGQQFWKDLTIVFSMIWLNLALFAGLLAGGATLLKVSGAYPQANWPGLLLDAFHMAITEGVAKDTDGVMPILLSFLLPLGMLLILGEGVLRVFSIYLHKDEHREEWDIMVAKTFSDHIVVCGVGELGRALVKRLHADHPESRIVLVDVHPGLLTETGLSGEDIVCLQADMTSKETLKSANCQKARLVLLTSGNDAFNLEAAYKIVQLNPQVEIWVRLHHSGLADLMDLARKPNLHFFSPYQQAAEVIAGHLLQEEKAK